MRRNGPRLRMRSRKYTGHLMLMAVAMLTPILCQAQTLWFVPPASDAGHQGFIRITNPTGTSTSVSFYGIDDAGSPSAGTPSFTLGPQESKQFNSIDLESGAVAKGLVGALGTGAGNWRLLFSTAGLIDATALVRVPSGFLTSVHDADANKIQLSTFHVIPTLNPATNVDYVSVLRFVNPNPQAVTVTFFAYDDAAQRAPPAGSLSFKIGALKAVHLTSTELENGAPAKGLASGLGSGTGKRRVTVSSNAPIKVMNMIFSSSGFITELPTESTALDEAGYFTCTDFEGAFVISQDVIPVYLGFFGGNSAADSIGNSSGSYGSSSSATSMRDSTSAYGSIAGNLSALNPGAGKPPLAMKNSKIFAAITTNSAVNGVSLTSLDSSCTFSSTERVAR